MVVLGRGRFLMSETPRYTPDLGKHQEAQSNSHVSVNPQLLIAEFKNTYGRVSSATAAEIRVIATQS